MIYLRVFLIAALILAAAVSVVKAEGLRVLGAGSLREVMTEIATQYGKVAGV